MLDQQALMTTAIMASMSVLLGALFLVMPHLTRQDLFFGVTVAGTFRSTPDARSILLRYRTWILVATAVSLVFLAWARFHHTLWVLDIAPVVLLLGVVPAYALAHARTRVFRAAPNGLREASLAPRRDSLPGGLLLPALPILWLLLSTGWVIVHWDQMPSRLPVRYDWHGTPTEWTTLSRLHVFGPSAFLILLCLVLAVAAYGIVRSPRRIPVSVPEGARESKYGRGMAEVLLACEYFASLIGSAILLFPLLTPAQISWFTPIVMIISIVSAPMVIILLVVMARKRLGTKTETDTASQTLPDVPKGDRMPDERWLWGAIYVNRDDPALFIPKRFGIGYTLNFGNRWSWVILALIAAIVGGGVLLPVLMK